MSMISWQMIEKGAPIQKKESELPVPEKGEVRVKIAGCGVCHTDLGFYYDGVKTRSELPLSLGHEISGIVEATGPGEEKWNNQAVVIPAVMPCGACDVCNDNLGNICRTQKMPGNDIPGGFASHIVVPSDTLCRIPTNADGTLNSPTKITLAELSVVADAITTPYQSIVDAGLTKEDTAIFIGVGGVGGFGAQIAKAFGASVIAIDVDDEKLESLAPHVDLVINSKEVPFKELRKKVSGFVKTSGLPRTGWKIFETSGTGPGQKTAFGLLTFGATLSIIGFTLDTVDIRLSNLMAFHAVARGNWGCLPKYYPNVVDLVLSGKINVSNFVKIFPLSEINNVFEMVHQRKIKERPILVP